MLACGNFPSGDPVPSSAAVLDDMEFYRTTDHYTRKKTDNSDVIWYGEVM